MKLGIVTFYRVPNYGAMLQAYSLWKYLEACGHEVVFIQHKRCVAKRMPLWRCFVSRSLKGARTKFKNYVRFPMIEFAKNYPQTRYCETIDDVKIAAADCDAYIVGSDQMWNPLWCSSNENLPLVMLDFAPEGKPRISYAVSFGTREWRVDQNAAEAGRMLKKFAAISVREESGVELVKMLSGREDAKWLLDPTLLHTADFYREIFKDLDRGENSNQKPYIFNYVLDEWADGNNEARALECVKKSLDIEAVKNDRVPVEGSLSFFAKMFEVQAKTSVGKWLSLIANSEFVVTNSFHGTVFAILFHKPFISLLIPGRMSGMNERILSLLKILGLEDRVFNSGEEDKIKVATNSVINWDSVDSVLSRQRENMVLFLSTCIR